MRHYFSFQHDEVQTTFRTLYNFLSFPFLNWYYCLDCY